MSHTGPGMFSFGGGQVPPLENVAESTLARMRGQLEPQRYPPPLSPEERADAEEAARANRFCKFCAGLHAMPSGPSCPRLASFELDGDGEVKAGTFWKGTSWAEGRVVLAEDATEEGDDGDD